MTTTIVQGFINSIPDKRIARAFYEIFSRITPSKLDTAITAHAGGTKNAAQALKSTCSFHDVTTVASAADSILLPPAQEGEFHFVKNSAAANAMQVFGQGTDTIDSVATGTGVSQLAGDGVMYYCLVPGNWLRIGGVSATEVFTTITATTVNAGEIVGADNSLGITGQAQATTVNGGAVVIAGAASIAGATGDGGAVSMTGGASGSTAGTGGAASVAGGAGTTTGAGGATSLTGGAGGNDAVGGAASVVGGAAGGGNRAGGAVNVTGGAGAGSAAGGAIVAASGAGGATGAGGAITVTSGAGGATSGASGDVTVATGTTTAGSGSATGAVVVQSGAGAASAAAVAGGASGAVTVKSQNGGANTGGATGQVGGAGGALTVQTGNGGATNSTGAHAGGAGGTINVTAGNGGNASAGTGNGGAGGDVILTPGTGGTTTGGTAGVAGMIRLRGNVAKTQGAPATLTTTRALTAAETLSGIVEATHGATGANVNIQCPTGTELKAAMGTVAAGDYVDLTIINISAAAADTYTLTVNTDVTIVGQALIYGVHASVFGCGSATFRFRWTTGTTFIAYRIA